MNAKYLVAAALIGLLSAPAPAQSVKAGIEAWQRADYAGAVAIWRPLADAGDADAQFNLGQAYRLGRGVRIDLSVAKVFFERAARTGHLDAATTLGLLLFQNGEQAQGLKWLRQAADQGEPRALLVYGTALYNGDGVTQDKVLGYAFVSRAAAQGLGPAKDTLEQLDKLMTTADRQQALALAHMKVKAAPPAAVREKPVRVVEAKPAASKAAVAKPKPAPPKPAVGPAAGNWRIQLGAFSQRGAAEALYRRVAGKGALAGRSPAYVSAGPVIRLQVGPYSSRSAAMAACGAVGTSCFPVQAN